MNLKKFDSFFNSSITKVVLLVICLIYFLIESIVTGDFYIYYSASSKIFGNDSIYVMTFGDGFHYLYSLLMLKHLLFGYQKFPCWK